MPPKSKKSGPPNGGKVPNDLSPNDPTTPSKSKKSGPPDGGKVPNYLSPNEASAEQSVQQSEINLDVRTEVNVECAGCYRDHCAYPWHQPMPSTPQPTNKYKPNFPKPPNPTPPKKEGKKPDFPKPPNPTPRKKPAEKVPAVEPPTPSDVTIHLLKRAHRLWLPSERGKAVPFRLSYVPPNVTPEDIMLLLFEGEKMETDGNDVPRIIVVKETTEGFKRGATYKHGDAMSKKPLHILGWPSAPRDTPAPPVYLAWGKGDPGPE